MSAPSSSQQRTQKKQPKKQSVNEGTSGQKVSSKLRGLPKDTPEVRISKTLSYILRHGAQKEGVPIRDDGYVKVADLLENPKLKSQSLTREMLQKIVDADVKQRYELISEAASDPTTEEIWLIKANQGHSLKTVQLTLKPILVVSDIPTGVAVHGTDKAAWNSISTQGLSKMNRNHIHLAQGYNAISGMRKTASVFIYIDVQKALDAGFKFFLSDNGVVLTEGNTDGFLPTTYFSKVEDSRGTSLL
ncbi:KptA family-domain-containing protein [Mucidula mucida]|nr:KptA family-domain-containing protein [Mucidula mucida]